MAYMSQEKKKSIAPRVKEVCARHGVKATLSVCDHSALVVSISEGSVDFFGDRVPERWTAEILAEGAARGHLSVNPHYWQDAFHGASLAFLADLFPALNDGNWDRSDLQSDYVNVGWYVEVNVGKWDRPYILRVP